MNARRSVGLPRKLGPDARQVFGQLMPEAAWIHRPGKLRAECATELSDALRYSGLSRFPVPTFGTVRFRCERTEWDQFD